MNDFNNISNFYFVGIGGIGMSALARYCNRIGKIVAGYDKTSSELTNALISEGISISFEDDIAELPMETLDTKSCLIIYTPAIPKNNSILNYFKRQDYTVIKRAALLGEITKNTMCLAVAGTHGKTTTSAILGHILAACDMPVTAFLGGIAENYHSNFIYKGSEITVVEADEFDRSFLQLSPNIACITSMDADHLDIYEDATSIENAFKEFSNLVEEKDNLLVRKGLPLEGMTVAIEETADFEAQNVRIENGVYVFDLKTPKSILKNLEFSLPGHHNLSNAVTALGMAILVGSPTDCLPKALSTFNGVNRRFSYRIRNKNLVLIDDYAHHPTEIDALYQAVTEMYPNDKKLIVFQPHLFSRTKDFADGFARSLDQFDEILLLDIYPAREEPINGITSEWLRAKMKHSHVRVVSKEELPVEVHGSGCKIKLMVGAGDIGVEVERITKYLLDET